MSYIASSNRKNKPRSGVALGGLGCGSFELRQDGQFYNWNLFNNKPVSGGAAFPYDPQSVLFFLVRYQEEGRNPSMRLLQIENSHGAAAISWHEFHYIFPWLDGVDQITYVASVPFIRLGYEDGGMPLKIHLEAWSPLIPRDVKHSSLPCAFFDFSVESASSRPITVNLMAVLRNCVGYDVQDKVWTAQSIHGPDYRALELSASGMNALHASFGTMCLASCHPESHYHIGWAHVHQFYERTLRELSLPDENNVEVGNARDPETGKIWAKHDSYSAIGRNLHLNPREKADHRFVFSWHFPNRYAQRVASNALHPGYPEEKVARSHMGIDAVAHIEGHYYSNYFPDAAGVAAYVLATRDTLESETRLFHDAQYASSLPGDVVDQINSHLNTFRTSSWLTREGNFGILEGLNSEEAFAGLSTLDVMMYGGVATAALFPTLEEGIYRAHRQFQDPSGFVAHAITCNFRHIHPCETTGVRIDLPAQYAYQTVRAGLWSGNLEFLEEMWPSVKAALDYGLRERDENQDGLPDMKGIMCSYDNFPMFGVAPYVATQWLAGLSAATYVARMLGDDAALARYSQALERGTFSLEETAWNGRYYDLFADGLARDNGCLTDQLLGHWACHLLALPGFLSHDRVASSLESILAMNFHSSQGLRNCQWPGDQFLHDVAPDCWVDQANTCWTGVELAFASLLLYEDRVEDALRVIRHVDARYRHWGMYWDHQEYGGHYFRPMSAWSIVHAALGMGICNGVVTFAPKFQGPLLWVTPHGYGHFECLEDCVYIHILSGEFLAHQVRVKSDRPLELYIGGRRVDAEFVDGYCVWTLSEQGAANQENLMSFAA